MNAAPDGRSNVIDRRELVVLATISFATLLVMGALAEVGARALWQEQEGNPCRRNAADPRRPIANCVARVKNAEGPWTTLAYNACGYRSPHPCGPLPTATHRIVVMGTSIAEGLYVPYEQTFSHRIERDLKGRCGLDLEFQNLASLNYPLGTQARLLDEVVALQPDAVVLVLAPYDLLGVAAGERSPRPTPGAPTVARRDENQARPLVRLRMASRESRALAVAQHFLLENDDGLFRAYRLGSEDDALRTPMSRAYQARYTGFDAMVHTFVTRLAERNIPLLLVPVPNRIQAGLVSDAVHIDGVDPKLFSREVGAIAQRQGALFVDPLEAFAATPHAERFFYAVDGHLTGGAHVILARALEETLRNGVPAIANCLHAN